MAGTIKLEIVTPEKFVVQEDVQIVAAPGVLGEFGILIGHTPFMTALKTGTIRFTDAGGNPDCVFVSDGFAEALPNKVTVLAESAERRCDIDVQRAKAAMERAKERLSTERAREDIDFTRAKAALERALERLKASGQRVD
jgi:F-type H+-transporting ATPase subunit epsilon